MARVRRSSERGFTLTELMAVVAIMGVLATIAIGAFVGQMKASKSGEALAVLQAIRGAEERYRAENQQYLGNSSRFCPSNGVGDERSAFMQSSCDSGLWSVLRPSVERPVAFGYWVKAGAAGDSFPADSDIITERKFESGKLPTEPWYVIQAKADADSDGTFAAFVATSFLPEVVAENEGE